MDERHQKLEKSIRETKVSIDNTLSSTQAMKQEPVLSVKIPRKLFVLWDHYIKMCKKLKEIPSLGSLTECIGELVEGISLKSPH